MARLDLINHLYNESYQSGRGTLQNILPDIFIYLKAERYIVLTKLIYF